MPLAVRFLEILVVDSCMKGHMIVQQLQVSRLEHHRIVKPRTCRQPVDKIESFDLLCSQTWHLGIMLCRPDVCPDIATRELAFVNGKKRLLVIGQFALRILVLEAPVKGPVQDLQKSGRVLGISLWIATELAIIERPPLFAERRTNRQTTSHESE